VLFGRTEIAPKSHGRVKRQYKSGDARNDVRVLLIFETCSRLDSVINFLCIKDKFVKVKFKKGK
jgi:hypothetical protein